MYLQYNYILIPDNTNDLWRKYMGVVEAIRQYIQDSLINTSKLAKRINCSRQTLYYFLHKRRGECDLVEKILDTLNLEANIYLVPKHNKEKLIITDPPKNSKNQDEDLTPTKSQSNK